RDALSWEFPNYTLTDSAEPLPYLLDRLKDRWVVGVYDLALNEAVSHLQANRLDAVHKSLSGALSTIQGQSTPMLDVDVTLTAAQRMDRYRSLASRDNGLVGITTGFWALDEVCGGLRPGQFVIIGGPPKAGKSTVLLWMAMSAHQVAKVPMFVGFEMSVEEQEERIDSIRAGVSASRLRDGTLPPKYLSRVEAAARRMELMRPFWLSTDSLASCTVSGLAAKAKKLRPDILFVDGMYLMQDDLGEPPNSTLGLAHISR